MHPQLPAVEPGVITQSIAPVLVGQVLHGRFIKFISPLNNVQPDVVPLSNPIFVHPACDWLGNDGC